MLLIKPPPEAIPRQMQSAFSDTLTCRGMRLCLYADDHDTSHIAFHWLVPVAQAMPEDRFHLIGTIILPRRR